MQTDPNFANYLVEPETGRIVLLDFGAVRSFSRDLTRTFQELLRARLIRDRATARTAATELELIGPAVPDRHQERILDMFDAGMAALRRHAPFDFAASDLLLRLRDMGLEMGMDRDVSHVPPSDPLLVQRKIAGTYLLAARLSARVDLGQIVAPYA